jgi:flagellar biosynthesis regulator FlbT
MPLKIRVKPEGKFFVNGATLKNGGNRPIDIIVIEGDVQRGDRTIKTPATKTDGDEG